MPRLLALGTAAAVAATGLALVAPGSAHAATPVSTGYVLRGFGYGLRVTGGSLPASSGTLGSIASGCMNKAGVSRENHTAGVALPNGLGSIGAVASRTWTTKSGATVNRYTQSKVASITIGNDAASLSIKGLTMTTHVWHDAKGFHSQATPDAASVTAKLGPLALPSIKLPTPGGKPVTVPGLVRLSIAAKTQKVGPNWAGANLNGLKVELLPSKTTLLLAHSWAYMSKGIASGVFGGNAMAARVNALGGLVSSSGQPFQQMPCKSPQGKTLSQSLASVPLNNVGVPLAVGAATATIQGNQSPKSAWARGIAKVADINIGNGALVVKGLVAQANVSRGGKSLGTLTRNAKGTTVGSVTVNGKATTLSALDGKTLDLPGLDALVKVETDVVSNEWQGIQVIGLRLTLLGASDATKTVVELARTRVRILKP